MSDSNDLSRRELLVAIGGGLSVMLVPAPAAAGAAPSFELKFLQKTDKGLVALDTIALPAKVAAEIEAGRADKLEFAWHLKTGKKERKLAEHAAPGRARLAQKKPKKP